MNRSENEFEDVLERARSFLGSFEGRADLYEANELVNCALGMRPADVDAWILKCQIMSALDDDIAALSAIEMAGKRSPKNAEIQYWKAAVLSDLDRHTDALRALDRAFRYLRDEDEWLVEDLFCEKAMVYDAAGRSDDALATYKSGLERCPHSALLRAGLEPLQRSRLRSTLTVLQGGLS